MTDEPVFLTPKEVAKIIGVHPKTIHLWLRTGKLQGTKISYRAWRIPKTAIDAFISRNSNSNPTGDATATNTQPESGQNKKGSGNTTPTTAGITMSQDNKMKYYIRDIMGEDKSH